VEELAVAASTDLVNGRGVEVDKQSSGNVLAIARLGEESLKRAAFANVRRVGVGTAIEAQTMLEAVAEMNGLAWSWTYNICISRIRNFQRAGN
jgi:hypothetical protein